MAESKPVTHPVPGMNSVLNPSGAQKPDLDWSQVRETALMLNLAVAQILDALNEGDESVLNLTESFTAMANNVQATHVAAKALPESTEKATILNNSSSVLNDLNHSIIAFQFYDKLTQRLNHVSKSLEGLVSLVSDPKRLYIPHEWRGLQEQIKSHYTVELERLMFDYILQGHSIEQALELVRQSKQPTNNSDDDIELF